MLINKLNQLFSEHEIYGYIIVMEQNMPTVSVVIPAYNAMIYLPKAVESVLRQTFTDLEILIINNKLL
jgi:cellulose synthase/poly-beta-1,6-N-acetylglucosamine synthase-like glycosyltransferase